MINMNYVYVIYCNIENANILSLFHSMKGFSSFFFIYKKETDQEKWEGVVRSSLTIHFLLPFFMRQSLHIKH